MDHRLLIAARSGDVKVIKQLIDEENNILNGTSPKGNTVLHISVRFGHWGVVKEIMKHDPKLSVIANHKGETAVHVVSKSRDTIMAQSFIESMQALEEHLSRDGISLYIASLMDHDGNTPLHCAVRKNNVPLMKKLAVRDLESLLLVNQAGESPISIAIDFKLQHCIKTIINLNPSALDFKGLDGQTTLHLAVLRRDMDIVLIILKEKSCLINSKDDKQRTPLHYAAALGEHNIVKALLRSSDTSAAYQEDYNKQIPLHLAAENDKIYSLKAMLDLCPNTIELLDKQQRNILHIAAQNGNLDAVLFVFELLEMEDLVNAADEDGNTPLHLAAEKFHFSIVYFLVENKEVDIRAINKRGCTALDIVQSHEVGEMKLMHKRHMTWRLLKNAYATRAITLEDIGGKAQFAEVKAGKEIERAALKSYRKDCASILVVAALITTVTFTAAFTIPGGLRNEGPDVGMATFMRKPAFNVFIVCDAGAMIMSMVAICMVFWSLYIRDRMKLLDRIPMAILFTMFSLLLMTVAFATGLFVVLVDKAFTSVVIGLGCSVIVISLFLAPRLYRFLDRLSARRGRRIAVIYESLRIYYGLPKLRY